MRPLITLSLLLPLQAKRLKDIKCVPVSAEKSLHISVAENLANLFVVDFVVAVVLAGLYVIGLALVSMIRRKEGCVQRDGERGKRGI
jgi:hypothetical protein